MKRALFLFPGFPARIPASSLAIRLSCHHTIRSSLTTAPCATYATTSQDDFSKYMKDEFQNFDENKDSNSKPNDSETIISNQDVLSIAQEAADSLAQGASATDAQANRDQQAADSDASAAAAAERRRLLASPEADKMRARLARQRAKSGRHSATLRRLLPELFPPRNPNHTLFDVTNIPHMTKYINNYGSIAPRNSTGLNRKQQRKMSRVIKRMQSMGIFSMKRGFLDVHLPWKGPKEKISVIFEGINPDYFSPGEIPEYFRLEGSSSPEDEYDRKIRRMRQHIRNTASPLHAELQSDTFDPLTWDDHSDEEGRRLLAADSAPRLTAPAQYTDTDTDASESDAEQNEDGESEDDDENGKV